MLRFRVGYEQLRDWLASLPEGSQVTWTTEECLDEDGLYLHYLEAFIVGGPAKISNAAAWSIVVPTTYQDRLSADDLITGQELLDTIITGNHAGIGDDDDDIEEFDEDDYDEDDEIAELLGLSSGPDACALVAEPDSEVLFAWDAERYRPVGTSVVVPAGQNPSPELLHELLRTVDSSVDNELSYACGWQPETISTLLGSWIQVHVGRSDLQVVFDEEAEIGVEEDEDAETSDGVLELLPVLPGVFVTAEIYEQITDEDADDDEIAKRLAELLAPNTPRRPAREAVRDEEV